MSNKVYCPECGTKMAYAAKMPNFCMNCGYSLTRAAESRSVGHPGETGETGIHAALEIEESLEPSEFHDYGGMSGLDVEISSAQQGGAKIGELLGTLPEDFVPEPAPKKRGRPKGAKNKHARTLKDFEKEAGAARRKRKEK